jgi:hypothetical protein
MDADPELWLEERKTVQSAFPIEAEMQVVNSSSVCVPVGVKLMKLCHEIRPIGGIFKNLENVDRLSPSLLLNPNLSY